MSKIFITKADGDHELFDPVKLEHSLERAGAAAPARARITARILEEIKPNVTTAEIYHRAFEMLKKEESPPVAARYSIKRAVFDLGPSGFPFEQFLAEVLRAHGWSVQTDVTLMGRCAPHEVDVVGQKGSRRIGIEAKFHNEPGGKTDIKDALYVHARYEDLARAPLASMRVDEGWLVTNTVFTKNAIRYAHCSNLTMYGWNYPAGRGLQQMIEEVRVHPLTCLTTLSDGEKRRLLESKIVLCRSVQAQHLLREYGVAPSRIPGVQDEARRLCGA